MDDTYVTDLMIQYEDQFGNVPEDPKKRQQEENKHVVEPLTGQLVVIALIYLATYALLTVVAPLGGEKHETTFWAFHFILGTILAIGSRSALHKWRARDNPLDDRLLVRISNSIVDLTTVCALSAVQVHVIAEWFGPLVLITSAGGLFTLVFVLWLARRAFSVLPMHHGTILYGAMTGTATTGLALLRMIDPKQRTPVARNYVIASAGAAMLALPLMAVIPRPLAGWPESYPAPLFETLGIVLVYLVILLVAWTRTTRFALLRPIVQIWPDLPDDRRSMGRGGPAVGS